MAGKGRKQRGSSSLGCGWRQRNATAKKRLDSRSRTATTSGGPDNIPFPIPVPKSNKVYFPEKVASRDSTTGRGAITPARLRRALESIGKNLGLAGDEMPSWALMGEMGMQQSGADLEGRPRLEWAALDSALLDGQPRAFVLAEHILRQMGWDWGMIPLKSIPHSEEIQGHRGPRRPEPTVWCWWHAKLQLYYSYHVCW
jgi:hypothetical protein